MDKKREELLEKIENKVIPFVENYFNSYNFEDYNIKDVFCYREEVTLVNKETKQLEKFKLYAVQAENSKPEEGKDSKFELECLEDEQGNIYTISDLIKEYEGFESIKYVVEKTEENEEKPEKEQDEINKKDTLEELKEERENDKETDKENKEYEKENEQVKNLKINNLRGEVDLDQQVNGETLRKILGLSEEYKSIAPVRAETVGVKGSSEYCYVAIKNDNTCTVLGEDVLIEDRQEGVNPYDKDIKVNSDGSVSKESSISGFKVSNRPNFFISVGFDENSSTRETVITDVSGRQGREEEVGHELEKNGDGWQDADARNILREEKGIDEAVEIKERQKEHEKAECENDRVENIDDNPSNDIHGHITKDDEVPGKEGITFEQWANELGEGAEKIIDRFEREMTKNPNAELVIDEIESDYDRLPEHKRE